MKRFSLLSKYIYDYQINDMADFLDLKPGTVKSKISRALEKLKMNSFEEIV